MARKSSRKYHNISELSEVQLHVVGMETRPGKSNLTTTIAFHPDGAVMVLEEKGRTEFHTSRDGTRHRQIRPATFDEPHLKRVVGTIMGDVVDFRKTQRNLVLNMKKKTKKTKEN